MKKTRIVLIGGFLGAGKTTLIQNLANSLTKKNLKIGIVTNDQAPDLVDSHFLNSNDFSVREVSGGCFCCNFGDLLTSIQNLTDTVQPDIILAEPVGSCTDIVSTVIRPLNEFYSDQFVLSPFTVLIDPNRNTNSFDSNVSYLYDKQIEESEFILITKTDLYNESFINEKINEISTKYPNREILAISSKENLNIDLWIDKLINQSSNLKKLNEIDYEKYAIAESVLGWLNMKAITKSNSLYSPIPYMVNLISNIQAECKLHHTEIAHLKMFLKTTKKQYKCSLTGIHNNISWDTLMDNDSTHTSEWILNARIHIESNDLKNMILNNLQKTNSTFELETTIQEIKSFSPAPPVPVHRL
jgi:G3E family GTPase